MSEREYDVVLFGATGFTGRLTARYLAGKTAGSFRWAIAGRDRFKLGEVADECDGEPDILEADIEDAGSLAAMARSTRVLATTVGPYIRYGEPVVKAVVDAGTDYVDLTGEPAFVAKLLKLYDAPARSKRIRVVNSCGFDSIPHDLGAWMMVQELPDDEPVTLEGFVSAKGGISGGTWNSALEAFGRLGGMGGAGGGRDGGGRRVRGVTGKPHYEEAVSGWVAPMPTIDPLVILRSARALAEYGNDFTYSHYLRVGSLPMLVGLGAGIGTVVALAQIPPLRRLLGNLRPSGAGPDEETMKNGWFRITFIGEAGKRRVVGEVSGGEPGYAETSRMLAESALCLALDRGELPERHGVVTTAEAMAEPLTARLKAAGMRFEILEKSGP